MINLGFFVSKNGAATRVDRPGEGLACQVDQELGQVTVIDTAGATIEQAILFSTFTDLIKSEVHFRIPADLCVRADALCEAAEYVKSTYPDLDGNQQRVLHCSLADGWKVSHQGSSGELNVTVKRGAIVGRGYIRTDGTFRSDSGTSPTL